MPLTSDSVFDAIKKLESGGDISLLSDGHAGHIDVLIPPGNSYPRELTDLGAVVISGDVGRKVEEERALLSASPGILQQGGFSYDTYHEIDIMYAHLDALATSHSDKAETFNLPGDTHEGRKIKAIRITSDISTTGSSDKPMLWLDGGIHAREWVSPATVMYIIDTLLGEEESDKKVEVEGILDKFQVVIAPCINPDGYVHTLVDRLWRKTRKPSGCWREEENWFGGCFYRQCFGADPNRNWGPDDIWGTTGVSSNPCSIVYPGTRPFDQANTAAVKSYLESHQSKLQLYVTYHSYSQLFLTPVGYSADIIPENNDHYLKVGAAVVDAIRARHGTEYTAMRSGELYPASGDSPDWVHLVLGLTDAYTVELRDTGEHGFELPPEQILPTAQENVDGLLALIANIEYNN